MKRTGLLAFLFTVTACSGFGASDDGGGKPAPAPAPVGTPTTDTPAAPPLDGKPTVDELTEEFGVFVTASGANDGDGTRAHPVATIGKGIELATAKGKRVYVCAGTYAEALVVADGIPIAGGLDCSAAMQWKPSDDARSRVTSPTSPAVTAKAIAKPTRIDHLEIVAPDATTPSGSSIGLLAVDAGGLVIAGSKITAGKGMKGEDGIDKQDLELGLDANGSPGTGERHSTPVQILPGGAGGIGHCIGTAGHDGENGGAGGVAGIYDTYVTQVGGFRLWRAYAGDSSYASGPGQARTGADGENGVSGASAANWGRFDENGFTPADGQPGTDGKPGKGGKGGDGVGMYNTKPTDWGGYIWNGNGGAGGGAGGCPGLAGTPGKGGGASVAVLALRSAMTLETSEIVAGDGGAGGKGTYGSTRTPGAPPGAPGVPGTAGAPGGQGGLSGTSGSGAGGPSIAIAHAGGAPTLIKTTTAFGQPGSGVGKLDLQVKHIAASANGIAEAVHKLD